MPIDRSKLRAEESQNKMQSTLDKSKGSIVHIEKSFKELNTNISSLNQHVAQLKNIELLQVAQDYKMSNTDKEFYSVTRKDQIEKEASSAHIVESTARQEAGLRAIAKRITLLHSFLAGDSVKQSKERLTIASKEHVDSLIKHRKIGMAQYRFMKDRNINSISGLTDQVNIATGKKYTKEEANATRGEWDSLIETKGKEAEKSALKRMASDPTDPRAKKARELARERMDQMKDTFKDQRKIMSSMYGVLPSAIKKLEDEFNASVLSLRLETKDLSNIGSGMNIDAQKSRQGLGIGGSSEVLPEIENNLSEILAVNQEMFRLMQGNVLLDREKDRENKNIARKVSLNNSVTKGVGGPSKATKDGDSVLGGTTAAAAAAAALAAKKAAKKKAAAEVAKKAATTAVAKKTATATAKKTVATATAKKAVASATVKKVATKKVASKVSLSTIMALAKKVAAKMGWSTVAKHIATKIPALGLSAFAGPFGIAIAVAGALWLAYDIYQVLLELDKASDLAKDSSKVKADLLSPNPPGTVIPTITSGLTPQVDALSTVTKQKQASEQPSVDGVNNKSKATSVVNSGNTSNSGNTIVNNNYGIDYTAGYLNSEKAFNDPLIYPAPLAPGF